jgi:c-di-GMP-binding flagellar brake protein YcgR
VERHEESASEARVVFTSAAYDKVSTQRMIATSSVSYEQFKFNQLKAENVRRGNQRDL